MPTISPSDATEILAKNIESAEPISVADYFAELFPEKTKVDLLSASELARHIRNGLAVEEIVDLWNVVFPADRNVWYNEEEHLIHFNEMTLDYVGAD